MKAWMFGLATGAGGFVQHGATLGVAAERVKGLPEGSGRDQYW